MTDGVVEALDCDGNPDTFDRAWLENLLAPLDDVPEPGAPIAIGEYGVFRWAPGAAELYADETEEFEARNAGPALFEWVSSSFRFDDGSPLADDFNILRGSDPENHQEDVESALRDAVGEVWARNEVFPSVW